MIECYSIVACESAILDEETKNWSCFNLIDGIQTSVFGVAVPYNVLSFWRAAEEAQGVGFEFVLDLRSAAGGGVRESKVIPVTFNGVSNRVRMRGFMLPDEPGDYYLGVKWRKQGEENWVEERVRWYLRVDKAARD